MKPLHDICRCHDYQCPLNKTCVRFIYRYANAGPRTPHADSLRDGDKCDSYIDSRLTETGK